MASINYASVLRQNVPATNSVSPTRLGNTAKNRKRVVASAIAGPNLPRQLGVRQGSREPDLPTGCSRNSNGYVIRDCIVVPASDLDMVLLRREVVFLKQRVIIVRFVSDLPSSFRHDSWIKELEALIHSRLALHREAGGGFHFIKLDNVDLVRQVLDLSPCKLQAGTTIFQR